ncbi:MAG: Bacteriophage repressor helix-turn-helix domain [Devosia sp.]|nr:Bacteriophage repressor helix-turn-helix domain [Devosia sp.]
MALVVRLLGGTGRAAKIAKVSRSTIDNWRKEGVSQPIDGLLTLAVAAGISLDWLAGSDRQIDRQFEAGLGEFGQRGGN